MMAILEFIFESPWRWLGTVVLLLIVCETVGNVLRALLIRRRR